MSRTRTALATVVTTVLALLAAASTPAPAAAAGPAPPPLVDLPADQAAHPEFANEWYYTVGQVEANGRRFGFEAAMYRLADEDGDLYRADLTVTDVAAGTFHHDVQLFDTGLLSPRALLVAVGTARLEASGARQMHVSAALTDGTRFDLALRPRDKPMPSRAQGFVPIGDGASYYYSRTDLAVTGSLSVDGVSHSVTGRAWHDHQWGNWSWASVGGWTYMTVQLDNHLRATVADGKGPRVSTTARMPGGTLRVSDRVELAPTATWVSPHTGVTYGSRWRASVPELRLELRVGAHLEDQELAPADRGPAFSYWEGSAEVTGKYRGKRVTGIAHVEQLVAPTQPGGGQPPGFIPTPDLRDLT